MAGSDRQEALTVSEQ